MEFNRILRIKVFRLPRLPLKTITGTLMALFVHFQHLSEKLTLGDPALTSALEIYQNY